MTLYNIPLVQIIRFHMSRIFPSDMYAKRRLISAWASAQSDQNLCCPHEENLHPLLSKMRPAKIQIRLRNCAVWSGSSLGAHVWRYIFWRCDSYRSRGIDINITVSGYLWLPFDVIQLDTRSFESPDKVIVFMHMHLFKM